MIRKPAVPTNEEISQERNPSRKAILSAMQRMFLGQPRKVSTAAMTFSDLAKEADVGRQVLYRAPDLKERFEFLRDRDQEPSADEVKTLTKVRKLNQEVRRLNELQLRTQKASKSWKDLVLVLERAVNVLQEELRQEQIKSDRLARRLAQNPEGDLDGVVIPIRNRPDLQQP